MERVGTWADRNAATPMADVLTASRTRRFVGGLSLGYLHTVTVTLVGLWLTPYLLRHLDEHDYGLWLLTAQILFYLALTDMGVVALLPREVAFTTGPGRRDAASTTCGHLVGETTRLVSGRCLSWRSRASPRGG